MTQCEKVRSVKVKVQCVRRTGRTGGTVREGMFSVRKMQCVRYTGRIDDTV